jgi:hypothetical protein
MLFKHQAGFHRLIAGYAGEFICIQIALESAQGLAKDQGGSLPIFGEKPLCIQAIGKLQVVHRIMFSYLFKTIER